MPSIFWKQNKIILNDARWVPGWVGLPVISCMCLRELRPTKAYPVTRLPGWAETMQPSSHSRSRSTRVPSCTPVFPPLLPGNRDPISSARAPAAASKVARPLLVQFCRSTLGSRSRSMLFFSFSFVASVSCGSDLDSCFAELDLLLTSSASRTGGGELLFGVQPALLQPSAFGVVSPPPGSRSPDSPLRCLSSIPSRSSIRHSGLRSRPAPGRALLPRGAALWSLPGRSLVVRRWGRSLHINWNHIWHRQAY